ncbi:penicillin-binding protein 1A [Chishuiella changwenlii]|uniref:Penicillin-binding protein 1A n=1 Tax=Chishuiella changwenlii TaxID=1434701 RepID=A0A1M7A756_9FLAO|nr:transglycosylase domain-containing protein [Chishuiella changwenlii]GGF10121.1 penicillin-binding protein 1A [Chishuiella changwenlii]SHL38538.1 penicillin-binding protein 1A [Chishuiella changwenlii]
MENKKNPKKSTTSKAKKKFLSFSIVKRIIITIWVLFFAGILGIFAIFWGASNGWLGEIPNVRDLENPDIYVASEIISSDGVLLDRFEAERRTPVDYKDLPPHLVDALLAKEDVRFFDHSGVDIKAAFRAISSAGESGGGSTITQQLAKQLYTKDPSSNKVKRALQKIKEWVTSVQLEKLYTKEEIIAMYFNKFDFIYGAKGIESASKVYFNKTTQELNLDESATLVSMFQNPVAYNPVKYPAVSKQKRDLVLDQMMKYNKISKAEAEAAKAAPLVTDKQDIMERGDAHSAYFKSALRKEIKEWMVEYEKETGKSYNLEKDGLKIYVTLDSRLQSLAEEAVKRHLKVLQDQFFGEQRGRSLAPFYNVSVAKRQGIFKQAMQRTDLYKKMKEEGKSDAEIETVFTTPRDSVQFFTWNGIQYKKGKTLMDSIEYHKHILQAGLMSMDPKDGTIKAWVGGIDWNYFKFDHVKQARRQVGSTFKPFVYATAINQLGLTPCHTVSNERIPGNWSPRNANGRYGGSQDLRTALAYSTNIVAARLIMQTGTEPVIQMTRDLGVESPIVNDPTIALGSADLSLYEMVGAMSAFANGGIYIKPQLILRIEDKQGKVIKDYTPKTREVVNEHVAYTMVDLMKGVVDRGSGARLRNRYGLTAEIAGKTGTTNENSDGWFMGLTPNLVTGVWVGAEDRFAHFISTATGQGANTALPIWAYYMQGVYKEGGKFGVTASDKFDKPKDIEKRWDCTNTYGFHQQDQIYDPGPIVEGSGSESIGENYEPPTEEPEN